MTETFKEKTQSEDGIIQKIFPSISKIIDYFQERDKEHARKDDERTIKTTNSFNTIATQLTNTNKLLQNSLDEHYKTTSLLEKLLAAVKGETLSAPEGLPAPLKAGWGMLPGIIKYGLISFGIAAGGLGLFKLLDYFQTKQSEANAENKKSKSDESIFDETDEEHNTKVIERIIAALDFSKLFSSENDQKPNISPLLSDPDRHTKSDLTSPNNKEYNSSEKQDKFNPERTEHINGFIGVPLSTENRADDVPYRDNLTDEETKKILDSPSSSPSINPEFIPFKEGTSVFATPSSTQQNTGGLSSAPSSERKSGGSSSGLAAPPNTTTRSVPSSSPKEETKPYINLSSSLSTTNNKQKYEDGYQVSNASYSPSTNGNESIKKISADEIIFSAKQIDFNGNKTLEKGGNSSSSGNSGGSSTTPTYTEASYHPTGGSSLPQTNSMTQINNDTGTTLLKESKKKEFMDQEEKSGVKVDLIHRDNDIRESINNPGIIALHPPISKDNPGNVEPEDYIYRYKLLFNFF